MCKITPPRICDCIGKCCYDDGPDSDRSTKGVWLHAEPAPCTAPEDGCDCETANFRGVEVPVTDAPVGIASKWAYAHRPDTFQATFADLFQEAFDVLIKKQRSYGPKNIEELGFYGVFGRLASDKVERLRNLMNGRIEKGVATVEFTDVPGLDETIDDTLIDLANYGLILLALKRGLWGRPLEDPA